MKLSWDEIGVVVGFSLLLITGAVAIFYGIGIAINVITAVISH